MGFDSRCVPTKPIPCLISISRRLAEKVMYRSNPAFSLDMVSAETTRWLLWHAGFESQEGEHHGLSVAACVGPTSVSRQHVEKAVADLLDAMALLNTELNGRTPSEIIAPPGEIPLQVAYAVAEISSLLREQAPDPTGTDVTQGLARAAWLVETAWLAVLAGDIDDIPAHLVEEETMRRDS